MGNKDIDQPPYLKTVGMGQRMLMLGIILQILSIGFLALFIGLVSAEILELNVSTSSNLFTAGVAGLGFGALLCIVGLLLMMQHIFPSHLRVVFLVGTLIPFLNLIVLAIANHQATSELKKYGVKIGFLGAKLSSIRPSKSA